jgi:glutamine amidotransferase-like uncharacterized protein
MSCRAGLVWDTPLHFNRFVEDCGIPCEAVTPHLLAAPFFWGSFSCLIVPTGFANPAYSRVLPALRATAPRIRRFVENGGNLLVFGAAIDKPDAYDWLFFLLTYRHDFCPRNIARSEADTSSIVEDYDTCGIECDGFFEEYNGQPVCTSESGAVVIEERYGKGRVVVTSIHEYPSKKFLTDFCKSGSCTTF